MLASLKLRDIGPAPRLSAEFGKRLNIFTGDNGLGKTFLLDIAWWAVTGDWPGLPAWPRPDDGDGRSTKFQPQIRFQWSGKNGRMRPPISSRFDFRRQEWTRHVEQATAPGLVIYARVDGGFSLWDPARTYAFLDRSLPPVIGPPRRLGSSFHFSPDTLWNGLTAAGVTVCNGLIRDWVAWQNQPRNTPFEILKSVVSTLAPSADEPIHIGPPVRLSTADVRDALGRRPRFAVCVRVRLKEEAGVACNSKLGTTRRCRRLANLPGVRAGASSFPGGRAGDRSGRGVHAR
ncbi:MAG: AAA family ATPase [Isosphaeraceae bacterium]